MRSAMNWCRWYTAATPESPARPRAVYAASVILAWFPCLRPSPRRSPPRCQPARLSCRAGSRSDSRGGGVGLSVMRALQSASVSQGSIAPILRASPSRSASLSAIACLSVSITRKLDIPPRRAIRSSRPCLLRLGQIKHLTGAMANARFRVEAHAAHRTGRRIMIDDFVGIRDLSQGLAFVTLLPTRFLAGPFAQTRHPRRLLQPIARWRLAAVRTVQSEPALKFGDMGPQRRNQRNEFFAR
jgi:hypothetical protein